MSVPFSRASISAVGSAAASTWDRYTLLHGWRVADLCAGIVRNLEIEGSEATLIPAVAHIHDIGKMWIPRHVLAKRTALSQEEWALIKTHPDRGARLLRHYSDFIRCGEDVVRHHHERWDGAGYPAGLRGTRIPMGARIIAVADSFDAMTHDRPYRRAMPVEQAVRTLQAGRGRQWDPLVVDAFLRGLGDPPASPA